MSIHLCLPIARYSFAEGLTNGAVPWEHLTADNLFAVLHGGGNHYNGQGLTLRIVRATEVLESIDIQRYVEEANRARQAIEETGARYHIEQLPIFGMTKGVLLALRYRLQDGRAHRMQLRMQCVADCQQIVNLFLSIGMEFRGQVARPDTAEALPNSTALPDFRPLSAQSISPYFKEVENTGVSASFRPPVQPGSRGSRKEAMPQHEQHHRGNSKHDEHHSKAGRDMSLMPTSTRAERIAPRKIVPDRPTNAQMLRSRPTVFHPRSNAFSDAPYESVQPRTERPSSASNLAGLEALRQTIAAEANPDTLQPSSGNITEQQQQPLPSADMISRHSIAGSSEAVRPHSAISTTSATTIVPEHQDYEFALQRELRLDQSNSQRSDGGSRPTSAALSLPPLKKPRPVTSRPLSSLATQSVPFQKHETWTSTAIARTQDRSLDQAQRNTNAQLAEERVSSGGRSAMEGDAAYSAQPAIAIPQNAKIPEAMSMDELIKKNREEFATVRRLKSGMADGPHEVESPSPPRVQNLPAVRDRPSDVPPKPALIQPEDEALNRAYTSIRADVTSHDASLDLYAAQRPDDRQAILDDFMIENLENPSFTTLCEDVELCWRRIALGL